MAHYPYRLLTRQDASQSSSSIMSDEGNSFPVYSSPSDSFSIPSSVQSSTSVTTAQEIQYIRRQLKEIQDTLKILVDREPSAPQAGELPVNSQRTSVSLFSDLLRPHRIVPHPRQSEVELNGSQRKAQFSWKLMEWLVDHVARTQLDMVLGKQDLVNACNNAKGSLISGVQGDICATFDISNDVSWGSLPKRAQWAAILLLEERAALFLPLGSCIAHWGARLMIAKFWTSTNTTKASSSDGTYKSINNLLHITMLIATSTDDDCQSDAAAEPCNVCTSSSDVESTLFLHYLY